MYRPYHYPELQSLTVKNVSKIFYTSTLAQKKNSKLIHIFPMKKRGGGYLNKLESYFTQEYIVLSLAKVREEDFNSSTLPMYVYCFVNLLSPRSLSLSLSRRVLLFTCAKDHLNSTISSKECF